MSRPQRGQTEVPLPWERLLWSGRPAWPFASEEYFLTDLRIVRQARARVDELVLHDIGEVVCRRSRIDALFGTSTIVVRPRDARRSLLLLRGVRRGPQLAALLDLLSGEPPGSFDTPAVDAALAWNP